MPEAEKLESKNEPVWCIVANVVAERPYGPGNLETRSGTKHFVAGAKVYCIHFFWDGPMTNIEVVGRHRGSYRFVPMFLRHEWLTNWRVQLVYNPHIIAQLRQSSHPAYGNWDGSKQSKQKAEEIANLLPKLGGRRRTDALAASE